MARMRVCTLHRGDSSHVCYHHNDNISVAVTDKVVEGTVGSNMSPELDQHPNMCIVAVHICGC
jgi:hypothetical protein